MTPLEKVARAIIRGAHEKCCTGAALDDIANLPLNDTDIRAARAAIDALADAVSDEMVASFSRVRPAHYFPLKKWAEDTRRALSAAIRSAKGEQ